MRSMHTLLDEAERKWREEVKQHFPLRANTKVVRRTEPNGQERDWTFSTDLVSIFAEIANDEGLQRKFAEIIAPLWKAHPEELARDTLHYLLHHELYHPIEAPFSVEGEKNDNKRIHQSMRRGMLQAQPMLSPLDQVVKVQAAENGVKDFILDNRVALDNRERRHFRDDIIPAWDVLELQKAPSKTNFYTVTRLLYGLMYGPEATHEFFETKAGKDGHEVASKALEALLGKPVRLSKSVSLINKAKALVGLGEEARDSVDYIPPVREVFAGEDRYAGIERFMKVLGPYVEKGMPQSRPATQGAGAGGSPQTILQDLLDDMSPHDQQQFLQQLAQASPSELESASKPLSASYISPSQNDAADQMKNLDLLAVHEFYKRNHPKVTITGGNQVGERVTIGHQQSWNLKNSKVITGDQLAHIDLSRIDRLQQKTRLPWLISLGNGTYRLNEYETRDRNVAGIVYRDADVDVPDTVEFYLDSSGSMFSGTTGAFRPDNGCGWDMLSHVLYGFVDGLQQAGQHVGKRTSMRVHNFADTQIDSEVIPVERFWAGDTAMLRTIFKPENGYDQEDLVLSPYRDNQKRAYVVVTDGNLVIPGRTAREAKKMKDLARDPNNSVLLFEIGGTYSLGNAVRGEKGIAYHPVHNKEAMLQAGLEVLLSR